MLKFGTLRMSKKMRKRVETYGIDLVEAPVARATFVDVAVGGLEPEGFFVHDNKRFVREVSEDIRHLVELVPLKGKAYVIRWGVSLSFVPHGWKRQLRWHRTLGSARPDLFWPPGSRDLYVDGLHGEMPLREDMIRVWTAQQGDCLIWLESARTVDGVIRKAREQRLMDWSGSRHWPPQELVEAFCLARLGMVAEGKALFEQAITVHRSALEPVENLRSAFDRVVKDVARGSTELSTED